MIMRYASTQLTNILTMIALHYATLLDKIEQEESEGTVLFSDVLSTT